MITEPTRTMTYLIKVRVNIDALLETYADGQGLELEDVTEDVESILESEMNSWLDASGVCLTSIEEVTQK